MKLQLNIQKKDNNYSYTFERIMHLIYIRSVYVWNHFNFLWNLLGYKKQMQAALQIFVDLSDKVIRKKLVQKHNLNEEDSQDLGTKNHKVFLDCIMDSKQFGLNELQEEVNQFLFAGTETTSSTLCFIFAVLGMFQDIQHKVLQEILEIIGPEREPESKDLHRLEYMERVIKETLRLFPVVALFGRSMTEDCDVGDFVIPKLATVYFGVVYIHRNSKYWPDPLKFDPDRFLAEEVAKRPPCAYIPFSYGPRNCIGKNYSFMNMKVLIAVVLRKYKIHCDYKHVEDIQLRTNLVLRFKDDPKVYVTSR
ncbi:hypothetical protein GWI33_022698 [Rhynchophorus ferrugineus]|uniref:Cytochrome P450 n=1 Tax=Rhynchophorus ferrugineus TaxID=354439 RepID=A0A834MHH8_RHYFE|nr:hypothetical protein GWI33_022698 [Rhynchophorus ferrugineus]